MNRTWQLLSYHVTVEHTQIILESTFRDQQIAEMKSSHKMDDYWIIGLLQTIDQLIEKNTKK